MADPGLAEAAAAAGWAEVQPVALAGFAPRSRVMLYGPGDDTEADIIFSLASAVRRVAGQQAPQAARP